MFIVFKLILRMSDLALLLRVKKALKKGFCRKLLYGHGLGMFCAVAHLIKAYFCIAFFNTLYRKYVFNKQSNQQIIIKERHQKKDNMTF